MDSQPPAGLGQNHRPGLRQGRGENPGRPAASEHGLSLCLGIIRLGKAVGNDRLEAACRRALHFGTCSYPSIKSILQNNLEAQPLEQELPLPSPPHENLRGGPYYR